MNDLIKIFDSSIFIRLPILILIGWLIIEVYNRYSMVRKCFGISIVCSFIVGWIYLNFFHWNIKETLSSQKYFSDAIGYIFAWLMWFGALYALIHYIFIEKGWKARD